MLPGAGINKTIGVMDLDEILLNIMANTWINYACLQGFECGYITFKRFFNIFEFMGI